MQHPGDIALTRRFLFGAGALLAAAGCVTASPHPAHQTAAPKKGPVFPPPALATDQDGFVTTPSGQRIWYWEKGEGPHAVILMHPATGSAMSWAYQQGPFASAGYRTIAYSRGGYFRSDPAPPSQAVGELLALLNQLGVQKAHLVGSAAGAMTAVDFALSHANRTASLTLACSGMATDHPLIAEAWKRLLPAGFSQMPPEFRELGPSYRATLPEGVAAWLEIQRASRPSTSSAGQQDAAGGRAAARPGDGGAVGGVGAAAAPRTRPMPAFEGLAGTGLPILLMTGGCDLYMPPALLDQVAALIPQAKTVVINDSGHSAYWEQPDDFNRATLAFLKSIA